MYLGEGTLNMIQNADYEIPYLRKQVGHRCMCSLVLERVQLLIEATAGWEARW